MPHKGRRIHRSGLAKKKGGIGRHVTKVVNRTVYPNLQEKRGFPSSTVARVATSA